MNRSPIRELDGLDCGRPPSAQDGFVRVELVGQV